MKNQSFSIELKCLFCDSLLEGDTDREYVSGDMVECQNCHEVNDYDALIDVARDEGKALALEYAQTEIKKALKRTFKK